jgi:HlyD family secretion protein
MKKWQFFLFGIIAILIIGSAGYFGLNGFDMFKKKTETQAIEIPATISVSRGDIKETIVAPGVLVNYQTIFLPSKNNAIVEQIYYQPGQEVKKGDLLVQLSGEEQGKLQILEAQANLEEIYNNAPQMEAEALFNIAAAEQDLQNTNYQLSSLNYTPDEASLTSAQSKVNLLAQELEQAEKNYLPYREKPDTNQNKARFGALWASAKQAYDDAVRTLNALTGSPSAITFSKAEAEVKKAQANLEVAKQQYQKLENGINPIELEKAQLELSIAQEKYEALKITAPFDGVIISISVQAGETVNEGTKIIEIANPHALEVQVSIIEEDYPLIEVGQSVELYFDAVPDHISLGKVSRIIPQRTSSSQALYEVYITIDNIADSLVAGMTADSGIIIAEKTDVLRLPRALVRANSDNTATVQVWEENHAESKAITVGTRGDVYIEILSGLEEGELVISQ